MFQIQANKTWKKKKKVNKSNNKTPSFLPNSHPIFRPGGALDHVQWPGLAANLCQGAFEIDEISGDEWVAWLFSKYRLINSLSMSSAIINFALVSRV